MCQSVSILESLFTDAEYCFVGRDLSLYACWCPFSTCVTTVGSSHCEFTSLTLVIAVLMIVVGSAGLAAYFLASNSLSDILTKRDSMRGASVHCYRDALFGVYQASSDNGTSGPQPNAAAVPIVVEKTASRETSRLLADKIPSAGGTF
jgi:hypothetical protein